MLNCSAMMTSLIWASFCAATPKNGRVCAILLAVFWQGEIVTFGGAMTGIRDAGQIGHRMDTFS
jgi:hypothetical protein